MSSVMNRTAVVSGTSGELADTTAQVLANEFAHVIFLGDYAGTSYGAGEVRSDHDNVVLRLDTNGRPLRDRDD